ncbi:MAG: metalloregulator ArsR/SmtB family transcription factor [Nanoarchaeota archaeon]|nr:metalloregulator ArsR/SmtB family transcription factor [Nanoarchaeota archaeon]
MFDRLIILKALADETRIKIIEFLMDGERCACEIVPFTQKSQPNVSLHLKKLEKCGILSSRKDGTKILYKIKDNRVKIVLKTLK